MSSVLYYFSIFYIWLVIALNTKYSYLFVCKPITRLTFFRYFKDLVAMSVSAVIDTPSGLKFATRYPIQSTWLKNSQTIIMIFWVHSCFITLPHFFDIDLNAFKIRTKFKIPRPLVIRKRIFNKISDYNCIIIVNYNIVDACDVGPIVNAIHIRFRSSR